MGKPKDSLRLCKGFQRDSGNATKNWDLHDVSQAECEQIFFNQPLIVKRDKGHSAFETRYYGLGRSDIDRLLFVCFTLRGDLIRVISARDMTQKEAEQYET